MRELTKGPFGTGKKFEVAFGMGPLKAALELEITQFEQDRKMAWKTNSGPIAWEGAYTLAPTDSGGATLSQQGSLVFRGLWRLMEPLAGAEISRAEEKELEKVKSLVEAAS